MKKQNKAEQKTVKRDDLNNLVLDGMSQKVTWDMSWDNTQVKPKKVTVKFNFDGVVLGRLVDEAAIKHLKVKFAQRHKPKYASVDDFMERSPDEMEANVADLLSPMARTPLSDLDKAEQAYAKMKANNDAEGLERLRQLILADAENSK